MVRRFLLLIVLACLACSPPKKERAAEPAKSNLFSSHESMASARSEKELLVKFAKDLQDDILNNRRAALLSKIDWNQFIEVSAIKDLGVEDPEGGKQFREAFIKSVSNPDNPRHQALFNMERCDFIKLLSVEDKKVIVLRYIRGQGVSYMYYHVAIGPNGKVYIYDVSPGVWGLSLTASTETALMLLAPIGVFTPLGKYESIRKQLTDNIELLTKMGVVLEKKDRINFVKLYHELPKEIKNLPILRFNFLESCALIPNCDDVAESDYEQLVQSFPNDIGMLNILRNYYLTNRKFEKALKATDRIDQFLGEGKDPAGDIDRFWVAMTSKDYRLAKEYANKVIQSWPEWQKGTMLLFECSLFAGDHSLTLQALNELNSKFKIKITRDIEDSPIFSEFRRSPEYATWKKESKADEQNNK